MSTQPANLSEWLEYLQRLHPHTIAMGLDRVASVAGRMGLTLSSSRVVMVAGTNGKGSTIAALQAIALCHGLSVGTYTSPHLLRFNERIQFDGQPLGDAEICGALAVVEAHRQATALTFFEFTTLAALYCLQQYQPHLCLLEVGLGGRLDAVNIIDPDITVVTNIQLDHQQWLGDDREAIALEKAGIFRPGVPAICAERCPPVNLRKAADSIGARWLQIGVDFDIELQPAARAWRWHGVNGGGFGLNVTGSVQPVLHPQAVAAAIQAACLVLPEPLDYLVVDAVGSASLAGRCQAVAVGANTVVLDVAHNAAAMERLAQFLSATPVTGRTHVVLAMMADKSSAGIVAQLAPCVDGRWWLPQLNSERALDPTLLADQVTAVDCMAGQSASTAIGDALAAAEPGDRIVVTGSFFTVSEVLQEMEERGLRL